MGYIVGPTAGTFLYQIGGFAIPNITIGILMLCFFPGLASLPSQEEEKNLIEGNKVEENISYSKMLSKAPVVLTFFFYQVLVSSYIFCESFVGEYLHTHYLWDQQTVNYFFIYAGIIYFFFLLFLYCLEEGVNITKIISFSGIFTGIIAWLYGPDQIIIAILHLSPKVAT